MSYTIQNGRLGNQIIRNLAVSLIAEKNDLKVDYYNKNLIEELGIDLFSGNNIYDNTIELNDKNYFSIYNSNDLKSNLNSDCSYFQTKEITNFLYNYLHFDKIKSNIIEKNPFNDRYNNNNDLFVHIRLTDVAHLNPGADYYINTINTIKYNDLYVSSDQINHHIIEKIIENIKNVKIIKYNEIKTFQFGSTCKNIILSHGSFSAIIGYLAFFSNVYYQEYKHNGYIDYSNKIWYGDMFSINNWNKIKK